MTPKHFLDLNNIPTDVIKHLLVLAHSLKRDRKMHSETLKGKTLAMLFEKPSLRTRVSFDVGMHQLGGHSIMLTGQEIQLKSDTSIPDAARALSRYANLMMFRTHAHDYLTTLAEHSTIPVINGLTNDTHPCQVMADMLTIEEHRGPLNGKIIAFVGDGQDNVCTSWIHAAQHFKVTLRIAAPTGHQPLSAIIDAATAAGAMIEVMEDPAAVAHNADVIMTDTWVSMGQEDETMARREMFAPYQVNSQLMQRAKADAIFLHCLPAYRGQEVTRDVIDGAQSVVWDEAENRLHTQKAIMLWCVGAV